MSYSYYIILHYIIYAVYYVVPVKQYYICHVIMRVTVYVLRHDVDAHPLPSELEKFAKAA